MNGDAAGLLDIVGQFHRDQATQLRETYEEAKRLREENARLRAEIAEWEEEADRITELKLFAVSVADLRRPSQLMRRRRVNLNDLIEQAIAALGGES